MERLLVARSLATSNRAIRTTANWKVKYRKARVWERGLVTLRCRESDQLAGLKVRPYDRECIEGVVGRQSNRDISRYVRERLGPAWLFLASCFPNLHLLRCPLYGFAPRFPLRAVASENTRHQGAPIRQLRVESARVSEYAMLLI